MSSNSHTSAAFMKLRGDQKGEIIHKGAPIKIHAEEKGNRQEAGNHVVEAAFVDGPAKVTTEGAPITIGAGKEGETMQHRQLVVYVKNVLDTLPDKKVEELAEELEDKFEVFAAPDDLRHVELSELKEKLQTIKTTQKNKFLKHVEQLQNEHRD